MYTPSNRRSDLYPRMLGVYSRRVREGIRILDLVRPGWFREIDLPALDLGSTASCMLGQLHDGNYVRGVVKLSKVLTELREKFIGNYGELRPTEYGFETYECDPSDFNTVWSRAQGYSILTELWTAEINRRLRPKPTRFRDSRGRFIKRR